MTRIKKAQDCAGLCLIDMVSDIGHVDAGVTYSMNTCIIWNEIRIGLTEPPVACPVEK